ncbi:MAG: MerR family transcriptional regulator [Deltaproteobacteria bacterium]|nr:MerR family transcriptional regulator [Deltaproteobacteria bacterium]MBP6834986.1 MerR family transcriptional regulator [Deltaproteobacteria bacterium]
MSRRGPVEEPGALSARELAAEIGVSRDTLHSWIDRGLLTPVPFRGAATRYGASHQLRAKIIAKLRREGEHLDEIHVQLQASDEALAQRHGYAPKPVEATAAPTVGAIAGASPWERVELMPGLELHVASTASAFVRRVAAEVAERYRASASG